MDPMANTYGDSDDEMSRLWASGMPLSQILEIEQQIMRRRSPANDADADWSVIRDHTSGPLDHWLDGGDPDPRDSLPIGADPPLVARTWSRQRVHHVDLIERDRINPHLGIRHVELLAFSSTFGHAFVLTATNSA